MTANLRTINGNQNETRDRPTEELRPPEFTDAALALTFADENAAELRYVAKLGKWMVWDGKRWHPDETLIARHRARQTCRATAARCNHPKTAKLVASAKTIAAAERLAQADRRIAATVDQWDAYPWLLNTPAGIIDLQSGQMRKHDPHAYLTKITKSTLLVPGQLILALYAVTHVTQSLLIDSTRARAR